VDGAKRSKSSLAVPGRLPVDAKPQKLGLQAYFPLSLSIDARSLPRPEADVLGPGPSRTMKKHPLIPIGLPAAFSAAALASVTATAAPLTAGLTIETESFAVSAQAGDSEFGDPVTVNGVLISDLAIKRYLVYGPGRNALDARKLQILMDHERKLRRTEVREQILDQGKELDDAALEAAVDARMKDFDYDPGAVTRRLEKEKASFTERYPTLSYETELRRAYRSGDWYRDQVRQTTEFDQLFFPNHPDAWPALSIEAINLGSPQVDLIADYQKEYERRYR